MSRTYLAHAMYRWPPSIAEKYVSTILWPFAIKYANEIFNNFHFDSTGLTPTTSFAKTRVSKPLLHDLHTFGCPAFVLNSALQSGNKIPRWSDRAMSGIYLGRSPQHADNVSLILNLRTGHVSPQFHVVFDDDFTTVEALASNSDPDNWEFLCKAKIELDEANQVENSDLWHFDATDSATVDLNINEMATSILLPTNASSPPVSSISVEVTHPQDSTMSSEASEGVGSSANEGASSDSVLEPFNFVDLRQAGLRRSNRVRSNRTRIAAALTSLLFCPPSLSHLTNYFPVSFVARFFHHEEFVNMNADNTVNSLNPLAFTATAGDNEVCIKLPDAPDFIRAMLVKVKDHTERGHWVLRTRASIGDQKTIRTVWSFKRKRAPDGSLLKYKARLCVNGATQVHDANYWNTYAPVVSWLAVRLMFILSVIEGWYSQSIDFTLAFPQAEVEIPVFVEIPVDVHLPDADRETHVLELKKKLYGMRQASSQWAFFLERGMRSRGFTTSAIDQCVFLKRDCVVLVYVDDCLLFHKAAEGVDERISSTADEFDITREGSIDKYLGVNVKWNNDGTIEFNQFFFY